MMSPGFENPRTLKHTDRKPELIVHAATVGDGIPMPCVLPACFNTATL